MDEKLRHLMKHEGINSTRLAEILGIQASGISHIMSGRNKPSYDFLTKLLSRFPQINPDWLLLDKGPMYRDEIKNRSGATSASAEVGAVSGMAGLGAGTHANPGSGTGSGGTAGVVADTTNSGMAGATSGGTGAGIYKGMAEGSGSAGGGLGGSNPGTIVNPGSHGAAGLHGYGMGTGSGASSGTDLRAGLGAGTHANPGSGAGYGVGATGAGAGSDSGDDLFGGQRNNGTAPTTYNSRLSAIDNDDLIPATPSTHSPVGSSGQGQARPAEHSAQPQSQPPIYPAHNVSAQHLPATGNFTRSGAIERIVVFYKDKTFSEYQPE